jgi:hypothetical protein
VLEAVSGKVHGVADLGRAGEYQDEYVHTSDGWKFATRTVLTPPEKAAGLTAADFHAIQHVRGSKLVDFSAADQGGVKRFRTSGTAISVQDGAVKGRAYLKDGSYNDDVYEKTGPGKWRVKSSTHVPASAP